jgi:hypothetical protein
MTKSQRIVAAKCKLYPGRGSNGSPDPLETAEICEVRNYIDLHQQFYSNSKKGTVNSEYFLAPKAKASYLIPSP